MSWTTRIAHTAWHAVMFAPVNDRRYSRGANPRSAPTGNPARS
jgi:hypothetical protein